ncbi:hypothetical protein BCR32DRAFT_248030 [Anaeromyces robustus]|uniref:SH3 domain-containing protein n=1 Tax=Anaeromyces robustus TaxID=1754192 RepID=A0A1Y1WUZ6_9FUNG|nr:hypothetical protein BCR32DRAFT_248030 [Anaeromyces robustus]|eukprot:ORX77333.1 hypothetical protein BCR32DRAFT_248030 [Anaeromyces robustus]
MYSLNLLSCLILLVLGSVYVLTKPLGVGNQIANGISDTIFLDDIALSLVQKFDEESSSDDEPLVFDENKTSENGSIIGGNTTQNGGNQGGNQNGSQSGNQNGNQSGNSSGTPKPGHVTSPDGSTTNIGNSTVDNNGHIIDEAGNTVGTIDNGKVTDSKGNTVGTVDNNGNVVDNNGNTVANLDNKTGKVTPVTPVVPGNNNGNTTTNNGNNTAATPKPGVVTSPDGTTTDLSNATVDNNGNVNDSNGNKIATIDNGKVTDTKGNTVGTVDNNGNVVDNNGNTVANLDNKTGKVTPVTPVVPGNNNGNTSNAKPGVVTAPNGTTTDLSNTTVDSDGNIVDNKGNKIATIDNNGKIVDSKGNTIGNLDNNGNVVDNNGNVVANVDPNGKVNPTTNAGKTPDSVDQNSRSGGDKKNNNFIYFLLPALALVGGAGAFLYKTAGAATAAAGTHHALKKTETETLPAIESGPSMDSLMKEEFANVNKSNDNSILPAVLAAGTAASAADAFDEPTKTKKTIKTSYYRPTAPESETIYETRYGPGSTKKLNNLQSAPGYTKTTTYTTTNNVPSSSTKTTTTTTTTKNKFNPNYLLAPAANGKVLPIVPVVGRDSEDEEEIVEEYNVEYGKKPTTKKTIKKTLYKTIYKNGVPVQVPVDEESEEKHLSVGSSGSSSPEEIVEEYIIEEGSKKPKKTVKKTITTYKTIYKNGKPVQVPETKEIEVPVEEKDVTVPTGDNSYKSMIPMVIETIVKHSLPLGDKAEEEKNNDLKKLMSKVTEIKKNSPTDKEVEEEEYVIENGVRKPKKTIKKTITTYKTIYKNGKPVQVPVEEEVVEEEGSPKSLKSPKLKGIKKRITTYVTKDGKQIEVPVTEEFALNPKDISPEELPEEYKEFSSEEIYVPGSKSPKQKTFKKYVTVYKTIYKNGKPQEVVENIEIPEGKTVQDVLDNLPRGTHVKPTDETIEKRYVEPTTIEPTKDEIVEERIVNQGNVKAPRVHSVKKYVTTYKTTYKNGVPVEEVTESEDVPEQTEATYSPTSEEEISTMKSPKMKTIKKVTTYKTIYKNGKPVQVIEETPEETVIEAHPALIQQTKTVPEDEITEESTDRTYTGSPKFVKKIVDGLKKTPEDTEEYVEEYVIENGVKKPKRKTIKKKTIYKTIYKNGVPVQVPVEVSAETEKDVPVDDNEEIVEEYVIEEGPDGKPKKTVKRTHYRNGIPISEEFEDVDEIPEGAEELEEIVEEYEVEDGKNKPLKKTVYKTVYQNGVPVKVPVTEGEITERGIGENPYMKLAPSVIETIVKYALPNASNNDSKTDLADLMKKMTTITKLVGNREAPVEKTETTETTDRDLGSLVSAVTGENPYMKLAPSVIETIVKYALPNASDNDSKTDLADLMKKMTTITKLIGSREAPVEKTETTETTDRDLGSLVSAVTGENPYMKLAPSVIETIVKYALPNASNNDSKTDLADLMSKMTSITKLLGSREGPRVETREVVEEIEVSEGEDGEEIVEEYVIEEGDDQPKTVKKTVYKTVYQNGVPVQVPVTEETSEEKPNFRLGSPSKKGIRSTTTTTKTTTENSFSTTEEVVEEYSEALPSITEEDESKPMENNRTLETTSPTEAKTFRRRQLPKRSSSKRLSAELKAAVAAEIAKLENEINEETKFIPKPRSESITKSGLAKKESAQSIKAMAEGCLVRKPSNASSIKSNHSVLEEWSGPVFEKKVFEVVVEHTPQLPDEVKLNIGDLVEVKQVFEDGWAYGINTATKVDGTFPVICLGEEREPNKNGRYVPRLIRVYQARDEAGKKEIEDEEKFKHDLTEYAKKKKEYKLKKQVKKSKKTTKKNNNLLEMEK